LPKKEQEEARRLKHADNHSICGKKYRKLGKEHGYLENTTRQGSYKFSSYLGKMLATSDEYLGKN